MKIKYKLLLLCCLITKLAYSQTNFAKQNSPLNFNVLHTLNVTNPYPDKFLRVELHYNRGIGAEEVIYTFPDIAPDTRVKMNPLLWEVRNGLVIENLFVKVHFIKNGITGTCDLASPVYKTPPNETHALGFTFNISAIRNVENPRSHCDFLNFTPKPDITVSPALHTATISVFNGSDNRLQIPMQFKIDYKYGRDGESTVSAQSIGAGGFGWTKTQTFKLGQYGKVNGIRTLVQIGKPGSAGYCEKYLEIGYRNNRFKPALNSRFRVHAISCDNIKLEYSFFN